MAGVAIYSPVGGQVVSYPSYVQIGCDSSYDLSGGSNMTCQADGTWDQTPSCEPVTTTTAPTTTLPPTTATSASPAVSGTKNCSLPSLPNVARAWHSTAVGTSTYYLPIPIVVMVPHGAVVSLLCDTGFVFGSGQSNTMNCTNGNWSTLPTCNRKRSDMDILSGQHSLAQFQPSTARFQA